jgi:hypothetical protein
MFNFGEQFEDPLNIPSGDNPLLTVGNQTVFTQGEFVSPNFKTGVSGWSLDAEGNLEANTGTFRGALVGNSIAIGTDAWHVDSSGNMWWGSSSTYAGATIKISSSGEVNFTSGTFSGNVTGATITGGTITGSTIQTASSGARLKMYYVGAPIYSGYLEFLNDSTILSRLETELLWPSGGGFKGSLVSANSTSGQTNEMNVAWSGNDLYNGHAWFRLRNYYCGLYYDAETGRTTFYADARYKSSILPDVDNSITLGSSSYKWKDLYIGTDIKTPSITLNSVTRTSWPTSFSGKLSDLSINTAKAWGGYGITGLGTIASGTNNTYDLGTTSYYWLNVYADYIKLNSSYGRIYRGSDIIFDFYSGYVSVQSDLRPYSNNTYDLGTSSSGNWRYLYINRVIGPQGTLYFDQTGRIQFSTHVDPNDGGSYNLGGSTRYWGDINYKTLTDRGCLGWFDDGVELQDGRIVSDIEAIQNIKKHPTEKTIYGVPRLDYKTMPKAVYKKATNHEGKELKRDENDKPYEIDKEGKKIMAEDGAETTALISIMLGAIKELKEEIKKLKGK